jgi:hypothetical protein
MKGLEIRDWELGIRDWELGISLAAIRRRAEDKMKPLAVSR